MPSAAEIAAQLGLTSRWAVQWYVVAAALLVPIMMVAMVDRMLRARR